MNKRSKLPSVHEITVVAVRVVKLSHKILFFTKSLEHEWQRYLIYVSIVTILHCDFPRQVCVQWANLFRKNCMLIKPGFCESLDDPLQPFIARGFFYYVVFTNLLELEWIGWPIIKFTRWLSLPRCRRLTTTQIFWHTETFFLAHPT